MTSAWTLHIDDDWIAWLTFDRPGEKVNAFTAQAMVELDVQLDAVAADDRIKALVIRSGKPDTFIVGADIGELEQITDQNDALRKSRTGHTIFGKLAAMDMPTIAVIHGSCLGGGLEFALACDYRLVTDDPKTSLGLPEVNLGIIPGWGGTQRLPHVIGLVAALPMILTGKPANTRKAMRTGLADGVIAHEFLEAQTRLFVDRIVTPAGRREVLHKRQSRQTRTMRLLAGNPLGRALIFHRAKREVMKKTKGNYPAPLEALRVLRKTARRSLKDGLAVEAEAFSRLACTSISRNLVHLFQVSQQAKKGARREKGDSIEYAGVVGAGIMGGGIAWALSHAGITVRMKDINWDAIAAGLAAASKIYAGRVKRRRMTEAEMNLAMHRISGCLDYSGFQHADVIVEAVVEDLAIKQKVLAEIEAHVDRHAIIATNTSSLPLPEMATALKHADRFVGLHFFNPVHMMPLVEVVPCRRTSRSTVDAAVQLVKQMGKTPVVVGDCPGFLVNRILLPYLVESAWMVEEGVDVKRIDTLLERFGMPMGPLALVDEVGLDVGYKVARILEDAYGQRMHVPAALGAVANNKDWLGRKSGSGFYIYNGKTNGEKQVNTDALAVLEQARNADGISPRELEDDVVVDRAVLIMINEAARCLEESIVDDPDMLDLAMVMGTGFAPFRGGLLRYADERGVAEIRDRLEMLADTFGDRFRPAPLLDTITKNGGRFHTHAAQSRRRPLRGS